MEEKKARMEKLVSRLNAAAKAYYTENREIMANIEYDALYDELVALEAELGVSLAKSPTQNVGFETLSQLPKETHARPLLSLDKTKDPPELKRWLGDKKGLLSWKLDGLTLSLAYKNGGLEKAVTRGNGQVGEIVTSNARVFENIPLKIPFQGELILRGEAIIRYSDFAHINAQIEDVALQYKNPRNLSSGSVRQLNNEITAQRHLRFYAFSLAEAEGEAFENSRRVQMEFLAAQGFDVAEYVLVNGETVEEEIRRFAQMVTTSDLPSDGLVLTYDDIAYGASLGRTAKFPRDAIAFKWEDEKRETALEEIEWSTSRTGLINPIAIFQPVELEGTTVSRASVHNISILKELKLGIGDRITVYKANMIIPQIGENLTGSGTVIIPKTCPVCAAEAVIRDDSGVEFLYCTNPHCLARQIKLFTHFVSRSAMNIEGLSEATLEKFISKGFIHGLADIFRLERFRDVIVEMDGFGEKSYDNLITAIHQARSTTQIRLLYSLGIPNIGLANARLICRAFSYDWNSIQHAEKEALVSIDGIGDVMAEAYVAYFSDEENRRQVDDILSEVVFEPVQAETEDQTLDGLTFVITGSLERFPNRNALKESIESRGGKVAGSVSAKTTYLINNDVHSASSKNKKAKELGVKIIDETQLAAWLEEGNVPRDEQA